MSAPHIQVIALPTQAKTAESFEFKPNAGTPGQVLRIPAKAGVTYQLKDLAREGQKAPEMVKAKRVGKHLEITFESGNEGPDLVLENYYDVVTDGSMSLVGEAENGHMYEYAVSNANSNTPLALVTPSQGSVNAVLGSAEFIQSSGAALSEQSLTPLFALLGGVGIAGVSGAVQGKQDNAASAAALKTLQAAAQANNASTSTTSLETYSAAGITGVTQDNLAAINNALNTAAVSGTHVDTAAKVQAIVDAYNAILGEANGATPDTTPVGNPTASQYQAIGANIGLAATNAKNLALLNDIVGAKEKSSVDTVAEINELARIANAIQLVATGGKPNPTLTAADFDKAGITGVTDANLAAVVASLMSKADNGTQSDSLKELQDVVTTANNALAKFEAYKNGRSDDPEALTVDDYAEAGITGVTTDNLAAVNAQVLAAKAGEANSVGEVQGLVTAGNNALAKIENYDGTTALSVNDYAAAGITGVTADNLAAVNAQVLAAKAGEANSVAKVQDLVTDGNNALAKIENYDGTTALGLEDYAEAGITGVTTNNLAAVNAQVLAAKAGEANSVAEVQGLVTDGNNALAKIENYDGTNALSVNDYAAAGITGVTTDNLAAVNAQVLAAKTGEANSVAEVQGLVTAGNTALAKIENYNGTTALGLEDYAAAGITGVTAENLAAVNAQVLAAKAGEADSVVEVQDLVTAGNNALAKIENYDGTTALSMDDYAAAGITGVTTNNLAAVNAQVLAAKAGEANSVVEVQDLVTAGNTALAKIENYNGTTALNVEDYAAAGITGVTTDNLAAVNAQVLAAKAGEANSVVEVQDLVTAGNTALAKIENYNGTTALNVEDYAAAGITGVTTNNLAAVNAQVLAAKAGEANSVGEVQGLVTAGNNALAKIESYDGTTALGLEDYAEAGITGVTAENLAAVNAQVLAAKAGEANSVVEVQGLVTDGNNALAKIENYDGTTALNVEDYAEAGINGVTAENLAAVNAQVLAAKAGEANSVAEVQGLVTAGNNALAKIESYDGTTALGLEDYAEAGITGVTIDNLAAVNAQVLAAKAGEANSVAEIKTLVAAGNAALAKIENYDGTTALGLEDYAAAGITGVTAENLAAVNAQVLAAKTGEANSVAEVQGLVTAGNNALAKIENYDGTNALSVNDYAAAGITGVTAENLAAVNAQVLAAKAGEANSVVEVQDLVTAGNTALAKIENYNGTTALNVEDYAAAGITGVTTDNLAAVNAKVLAANENGANSVPEVQALASTAATAHETARLAISAAAQANDANGTERASLTQYTALGVTGVSDSNLDAINSALNSTNVNESDADSTGEVQAMVSSYNVILSAADGKAGNVGSASPTFADYKAIGVNNVSSTAGASLLSDWVDTKNNTDVDTISKLQAKANDVKVIMDVAALTSSTALEYSTYPALQTALGNLGITGVNNNNVGAVWVAIRDSANSGSDVDARSKLQAMVNAANDQPVVVAGPTASVKLTTNEDNPITFVIQDKLTGLVTDPDVGAAIKGISIHTLTTPITSGAWSYSTDGGVTWSSFPASINSAANFNSALFLNASDQLRFTPTANYNGNGGGIDFRVVDNTFSNTVSGSLVDIAVNGRSGQSMSSGALNFWASITAVNDAPELATGSGITYALPSTPKSGSAPTGQAGTLVSDLIGNHITDADSASAAEGIAITHVDTTRGSLWYSLDGGVNWIHIEGSTTLNAANALLLASDSNNRIYFEPTPGATDETAISAALKFRAWDQTTGAEGNYVDTTATGNTAFSSAEVSVSQAVSPVVIDLNRDGVLSYSQVAMDVDGDGHLDQTAWAGAQDGVLVWDKLGDGKVHDHSQYAFSQYGAAGSTDLQGLATGFDSNQDGELDAKDTRFAEFKVWQDANQNGISDAGEMHNLADVGIACIYLTSDGVRSNPATGVIESGHTTARATDGSSVLVSDAAFAYSALAYSVNGNKLSLLGGDMNLDFSSLAATHKNLAVVDLSGSGANTLKLSLNDVLATATSNGMHKLTLTGDANDTVVMDMADWTKKDATVTEGNHTYAVYNNSGASLFVDEAMKLNIL